MIEIKNLSSVVAGDGGEMARVVIVVEESIQS